MTTPAPIPGVRPARPEDVSAIFEMVRAFYAEERYAFALDEARASLVRLLGEPALGRVYVLQDEGVTAGYAILTFGYSLEYGGRDAFLDELFVRPESRGRGLGGAALAVLEDVCRTHGVRSLHLEVERSKTRTQALYERAGFKSNDRTLLTKTID